MNLRTCYFVGITEREEVMIARWVRKGDPAVKTKQAAIWIVGRERHIYPGLSSDLSIGQRSGVWSAAGVLRAVELGARLLPLL